jgi:hypothetical protein
MLVRTQGKIQVFWTERAKFLVKPSELLKYVGSDHHGAPTGNALGWFVVLSFIYFAKTNRIGTSQPKLDLAPPSIVKPRGIV